MSALQTPAFDAPAAAWGALAESIPGWKEPGGLLASFLPMIEVGSPIGDLPSPRYVIDPDHWAWEGWLLKLLGPGWTVQVRRRRGPHVIVTKGSASDERREAAVGRHFYSAPTLGRACIAAAAALGRWPGGEL